MTLDDLRGLSRAEKLLILMAHDAMSMREMDQRPAMRFSRVAISLLGRRGFFDYSVEELDDMLEDVFEDLAKFADSADDLVGWAQESSTSTRTGTRGRTGPTGDTTSRRARRTEFSDAWSTSSSPYGTRARKSRGSST